MWRWRHKQGGKSRASARRRKLGWMDRTTKVVRLGFWVILLVLVAQLAVPTRAYAFGDAAATMLNTMWNIFEQEWNRSLWQAVENRMESDFQNLIVKQTQYEIDTMVEGRIENLAMKLIPSTICPAVDLSLDTGLNAAIFDAEANNVSYIKMNAVASTQTKSGAPNMTQYNAAVVANNQAWNAPDLWTKTCNPMMTLPVGGSSEEVTDPNTGKKLSGVGANLASNCTATQRVVQANVLSGYTPTMPLARSALETPQGQQLEAEETSATARQNDIDLAMQEVNDDGTNKDMRNIEMLLDHSGPDAIPKPPNGYTPSMAAKDTVMYLKVSIKLQLRQYRIQQEQLRMLGIIAGVLNNQDIRKQINPAVQELNAKLGPSDQP